VIVTPLINYCSNRF